MGFEGLGISGQGISIANNCWATKTRFSHCSAFRQTYTTTTSVRETHRKTVSHVFALHLQNFPVFQTVTVKRFWGFWCRRGYPKFNSPLFYKQCLFFVRNTVGWMRFFLLRIKQKVFFDTDSFYFILFLNNFSFISLSHIHITFIFLSDHSAHKTMFLWCNTVFPFAFVTLGEIRSTWFDAMELPAASCKQCSYFHVRRRTLHNRPEKK